MRGLTVQTFPIFYGWVILAAGTLGIIMASPGQTYSNAMFIEHFLKELDLTRTQVSALYMTATLIGSFALPTVGRQIDQRGCRKAALAIVFCFGTACIFMSQIESWIGLILGFIGLRLFGQGSLCLVSFNVINQWWVRRRGTVMGMAGMASALLGVGTFPPLINRLITTFGWRAAFLFLGLLVLVVMIPVGGLLFRDRPELFGLSPDGDPPLPAQEGEPITLVNDWTLEEARKTSAFWLVASGLATIAMLITGLHFHAISIFADSGLTRTVAADIFFPIAATTALVTLISGILKDRFPIQYLLAASLALLGICLILATHLTSFSMALVYGVTMGITAGLFQMVSGVVWADLFGRTSLGSISGLATTLVVMGSALGPLPMGYAHDLMGGYRESLLLASALPFGLAVATLFMKTPER